jgi:purine-binding chemotaxis protein CheW
VHAQYVTLGASGEVFGTPVGKVQEILDARPIARLPQMPGHMLGIIDVRGRTIPVVDLRGALGFDAADDTGNTRILVISIDGPDGESTVGVRTDRVFEVTGLDDNVLEPATSGGGAWAADCVAGIGRRNGGFVTVLDFDRLLRGMGTALS